MFKYFQLGLPPAPLLAAAGFPIGEPFDMYFSHRFKIPVSAALQLYVLPILGEMEARLPTIDVLPPPGKPAFRARLEVLK